MAVETKIITTTEQLMVRNIYKHLLGRSTTVDENKQAVLLKYIRY